MSAVGESFSLCGNMLFEKKTICETVFPIYHMSAVGESFCLCGNMLFEKKKTICETCTNVS